MPRMSPSSLRNLLEVRVRRLARTYSKEEQLASVNEAIDLLEQYKSQLWSDIEEETTTQD